MGGPLAGGPRASVRRSWSGRGDLVLGLGVTTALALVAAALGRAAPVIGGPVFGIVLGACARPAVRAVFQPARRTGLHRGFSFAGRYLLQASIVLLGAGLPMTVVLRAGLASLPVLLGTLAVAAVGCAVAGRLLRVPRETRTLIGAGTGICGGSAIAAVAAVIGAKENQVAYALATIFTFNIAAVLTFPLVGHLLGLSQHGFGLWAGSAINDTSSVVATAYGYGAAAGASAVIVKLTRSLMIVPVCVALRAQVVWRARRSERADAPQPNAWRSFPVFILLFLLASLAATAGAIPAAWRPELAMAGVFLTTVALTGIGLSLDAAKLRRAGPRPLLLGAVLWVAVAASSLAVQALTGQL